MRGLKVKNGIVDNIAIFDNLPKGWVEVPDGVGVGWTDNGDGTFSAPVVITEPKTIEEQNADIIAQLDMIDRRSIRALREGDQIRIEGLEVEAVILREQLQ